MEKLHLDFLCVPVCACSVFHEHPVEPANHLERSDGVSEAWRRWTPAQRFHSCAGIDAHPPLLSMLSTQIKVSEDVLSGARYI
jgi:hypothetical protein